MGEPILAPLQPLKIKGAKGAGGGGSTLVQRAEGDRGRGPSCSDGHWLAGPRPDLDTHKHTYIWAGSGGEGGGSTASSRNLGVICNEDEVAMNTRRSLSNFDTGGAETPMLCELFSEAGAGGRGRGGWS